MAPFLKLSVYIFISNKISLLFHPFFIKLTCSCPYLYNLMLTATYMCRPYLWIDWFRQVLGASISFQVANTISQGFHCFLPVNCITVSSSGTVSQQSVSYCPPCAQPYACMFIPSDVKVFDYSKVCGFLFFFMIFVCFGLGFFCGEGGCQTPFSASPFPNVSTAASKPSSKSSQSILDLQRSQRYYKYDFKKLSGCCMISRSYQNVV
jgi:hypothetical protein